MFGNRSLSIQLVKTPKPGKNDNLVTVTSDIDWDKVGQIAAIAQESAETTAKVVVALYLGKKVIDTACDIAKIAATAKFNA